MNLEIKPKTLDAREYFERLHQIAGDLREHPLARGKAREAGRRGRLPGRSLDDLDLQILKVIEETDHNLACPSQVREALGLTQGQVTGRLRKLVEMGKIERCCHGVYRVQKKPISRRLMS